MTDPQVPEERSMPLTEHLEELRKKIIYCLVAVVALSITFYFFSDELIRVLSRPVGTLYFFTPTEAFIAKIKVSVAAGVAVSLPFIVYQVWGFVVPALTRKERSYALPLVFSSSLLFVGGLAFAYFIVLPVGIRFLLSFGSAELQALIGVTKYLGFILWMLLIFGFVFQLPVVVFFLDRIGVVSPQSLRSKRKHVIITIFIVSAILTPPDVLTQFAMSLPIILLYEASILIVSLSRRRTRR
jgi:sec-independent protein translocase protein TatC